MVVDERMAQIGAYGERMKDIKDLSLAEKDILGFYDDVDQELNMIVERIDADCQDAIKRAIELAKDEGVWEELIANNDPEDILIELQTMYPECFEEL